MSKHTPEPWELRIKENPVGYPAIVVEQWSPSGQHWMEFAEFFNHLDAETAVKRWNACAGIPDPEKTVPEMVEALKRAQSVNLHIRSRVALKSPHYDETSVLKAGLEAVLAKIGGINA